MVTGYEPTYSPPAIFNLLSKRRIKYGVSGLIRVRVSINIKFLVLHLIFIHLYSLDGVTSNKCLPVTLAHGLHARLPIFVASANKYTRNSATAEEPHDMLRQLKYYGRFLTDLLTRSSANAEERTMQAHCQLQSCKMLHKCLTNCILKLLQAVNDLQGHSR